jgi:hypothetical protein
MTPVAEKDFVEWLKQNGLTWDNEHGYIDFNSDEFENRFWAMPERGARIVYFLSVILNSLDPWTYLMVCKQGASGWNNSNEQTGIIESVHDQIVSSVPVSKDFRGALRVERSDFVATVTLLFNQLLFGWCMWDDVYVIPDHARQIVKTSHHDVVHVSFRNSGKVAEFVEKLAKEKFYLSDEVPDGTFKTPAWMKKA